MTRRIRLFVKSWLLSFLFSGLLQGGPFRCLYAAAQEQAPATERLPDSYDTSANSGPEHDPDDLLFPLKRNLWFQQQRAYPGTMIPKGAYWRSLTQKRLLAARHRQLTLEAAPTPDPYAGVTWTPDGPQPTAAYFGPTPYSGRATAVAVHPTDPNTVYLGTAAGGVWKTTDGGVSWQPLTDSQASLAIGAVAIDPNNPATVFAGTGEPDMSTDSYYGQGLLKSTDAGKTWTLIRAPFTSADTAPAFTQIAVQPGNSNIVLAGNQAGLYRSADGGATWATVINGGTTAVLFDVTNASIAYAGTGGFGNALGPLFKSTDSGKTWTSMNGAGVNTVPQAFSVLRTAMAEDSSGKTLFAAFARSDFGAPGSLYQSVDGGNNWTKLSSPSGSDGFDWYRNAVAVVPTNGQVLYASGAGLYESTDGGKTWTQRTGIPVYADQHAFAFSADGTRMYLADDGGVFVTTDPADANSTFVSLNAAINSMTFYPGFSLLAGKPNSLLAGSQDHGVNLYTGSLSWPNGEQSGFCGDGGSVYVDPQGKYAYAHCQGGPANWTANASGDASTTSWVAAQNGIDKNDRLPWVADIKGDQQTVSTVYTGTNRLYQSTNNAASWSPISPDLTGGRSALTTIGVSPSDSNTIYTGAGDGTVSVTKNALSGTAATWTTLSGLPNRSISKIVVRPGNANDVYVTVSGFDSGHAFHSTDGGATWADVSGDLPNTPVDSILVDPDLLHTIYLATDTGVYVTENDGVNWTPLGQGLPNVVVQDILMYEPTRTLRVITHGRGAWDAILPAVGLGSSARSLDFGTQTRGTTSSSQTVTLTNNQQTTINIKSIQISGQFAEANNCGASLASSTTCVVSVTFAPTTVGAQQGSLVISSDSNDVSVTLSGSGVGIPTAVLNNSSLSFGNQPVGIAAAAQVVQLSNNGDGPLANIVVTVSGGNTGDFSQTNTCGTTLAVGGACSISVIFNPVAAGTRSATLSVADNAADSPQSVGLSGTGIAPYTISVGSTSATVSAGSAATYQLSITAQSTPLASALQMTCSGLPSLSACSFSPPSVPSGVSSQSVTLTVTTTAPTARAASAKVRSMVFGVLTLFSLFWLPLSRRRGARLVALALICTGGLLACGGGGNASGSSHAPGTPTGTYTVTVTVSQGTIYQAAKVLTLIVQ